VPRPKKLSVENVIRLGKPLFGFPVLGVGGSKEKAGAVYEMPNGSRHLVFSSKGVLTIGKTPDLSKKIQEYEDALAVSELARFLLQGRDKLSDPRH